MVFSLCFFYSVLLDLKQFTSQFEAIHDFNGDCITSSKLFHIGTTEEEAEETPFTYSINLYSR